MVRLARLSISTPPSFAARYLRVPHVNIHPSISYNPCTSLHRSPLLLHPSALRFVSSRAFLKTRSLSTQSKDSNEGSERLLPSTATTLANSSQSLGAQPKASETERQSEKSSAGKTLSFLGLEKDFEKIRSKTEDETDDEHKDKTGHKDQGNKPEGAKPQDKQSWDYLKRLYELAQPELKLLFTAAGALAVSSASSLIIPSAMGKIIDSVMNTPGAWSMQTIIAGLISVFIVSAIAAVTRISLVSISCQRVVARLRKTLFENIIKQDVSFLDDRKIGELVNRLATDTTAMTQSLIENFSYGLRRLLEGVGGLAVLFYLAPKLTLTMLLVVPPVAIGGVIYGRYVKKLSTKLLDALGKSSSLAEEKLGSKFLSFLSLTVLANILSSGAIRTVKAFAQEEKEKEAYNSRIEDVYVLGIKVGVASALFFGGVSMAINFAALAVLYHGGSLILANELTAGQLMSFLFYSLYVGFAFSGLSNFYTDYMKALGASRRVFELLDRKSSILSAVENKIHLDNVRGRIELQGVSFAYPSRPDSNVLVGLNLVIEEKKSLALVGPSGCGKSTVSSLLLRFYDPSSGRVLLDGQDVRQLDQHWLRTRIGLVPQDIVLFSGTIAENIRYGNPSASLEEVQQAAMQANAHHFITSLPQGYFSQVGEKGNKLSGGQKQRIAIARAILKKPAILILDEATSSLDVESEHLIQNALEQIKKERTLLIIAHRLSTIKIADAVAVLDAGQVVQYGSYSELLQQDGLFKNYVEKQI